ncbi:MAG: hypothetical protein HKN43_16030 [Rhodothermales bacterium]|nr:hypothetical protein [Rhodothermales bacterium]
MHSLTARLIILLATITLTACSDSKSTTSDGETPINDPQNGEQPTGPVIGDSPGSDHGVLNQGNAHTVILQAFEVLTGRAYDRRLVAFPYTQAVELDERVRYLSRDCQNEGAVVQTQSTNDGRFTIDSFYSDCQIGGDVLNGRVLFDEDIYYGDFKRSFTDNFSVTFPPGGRMEVTGTYEYSPSLTGERKFAVNNFDYHFTYSGGRLTILNADTDRSIFLDGTLPYGKDSIGYMTGSFTMITPVLNGSPVDVAVTENFTNLENRSQITYEWGRMTISADDSEITVDANTGDLQTVEISVTTPDGITTSRIEDWSSWYNALSFEPAWLAEQEPIPAPGGNGTIIYTNNYKEILAEVFGVYTGDHFAPEILDLPGYPLPDFPDGFLDSNASGYGEMITQQCANGGSAVFTPYKIGYQIVSSGWQSVFTNCGYNGSLYNGSFETRQERGNSRNWSLDGLSIESEGADTRFSGSISYIPRPYGFTQQYSLFDVNYSSNESGNPALLHGATLTFDHVRGIRAIISGGFTLKSKVTQNVNVNVTTADPLLSDLRIADESDAPPVTYFRSGLLVVDAGDNNLLWVNAATNDGNTFSVTIFQPDVEPVQLIENWQDWHQQLAWHDDLLMR